MILLPLMHSDLWLAFLTTLLIFSIFWLSGNRWLTLHILCGALLLIPYLLLCLALLPLVPLEHFYRHRLDQRKDEV